MDMLMLILIGYTIAYVVTVYALVKRISDTEWKLKHYEGRVKQMEYAKGLLIKRIREMEEESK